MNTIHPADRGRFDAVVETNRPLCREHFLLRLRVPKGFPATAPGQFIQVGCRPAPGRIDAAVLLGGEMDWSPGQALSARQLELCEPVALLRRPFSLAGRGDDARGAWLEIVHRVVGVGTRYLSELKVGQRVDLIGPLGNSFTLPGDKSMGVLVGGGVGLPPMFYLAEALHRAGWRAIAVVGAVSRDLLAVTFDAHCPPGVNGEPAECIEEFTRYGFPAVVTTNDGSAGMKGLITRGLEHVLASQSPEQAAATVVFTCGPHAMMHAVAKLAGQHGVDCQACLEQAMACGMGTCQSCVVKIEDWLRPQGEIAGRLWRYRLACTDGPVFDARHVVW